MVASRPFAYNPIPPNSPIFGTTQLGDLAIGNLNESYADNYGGVKWWNGPEEASGYVIAVPVSGNTQPTPDFGVFASVGFYRSKQHTDPSFLEISNYLGNKQGQPPFTNTQQAYDWLTAQGYWTSFVAPNITPTPTPTPTGTPVASTPTPTGTPVASTPTPTGTPTPTPTSGGTGNFNVTVSQVGPNVVWNGSGYFNLAALSFAGPNNIGAGFAANQAIWAIGPSTTVDTYSATSVTYPTSFGNSGVGVSSASGSTMGILPGGSGRLLYVPSGYTSNTVISGSGTYSGQTISSMQLSAGTYTWIWTTGGNSTSVVMNIVP